MASSPITSWQIDGKTMETVRDFIFLGSQIITDCDCRHEIKVCLFLGRKNMANIVSSVTQLCPTLCDPMDCSTRSAFFMVQLSHPHMTTRKTIALTRWTFVGKVMSLLFNMLSSWSYFSSKESFNFKAAITIHSEFGAQENKVCHCFHCFPIYLL